MGKNELLASNLADFRKRFGTFHDALIHHVQIDLYRTRLVLPYQITIVLGTEDLSLDKDRRVNLTLEIVDIKKFALAKEQNYGFSVVNRLTMSFFGDEIYIDLFPALDKYTTLDDYHNRNKSFDSVNFFVVGKQCFWSISPYRDRGDPGFLSMP
jgi:hypothetical protein